MIDLFFSAFVTFFVVIDPLGCAPIFSSLMSGAGAAHARATALRAVAIASAILLVFGLFGEALLAALGITLGAFRIAGGIMLFLIALEMVFERRTARRETRVQDMHGEPPEDISVFPMAIPMIAGPGSIASVMLLFGRSEGLQQSLMVFGALAATLLLTLAALLAASPLMRLLGPRLEAMITRLLGVILAALAAQITVDGIRASFPF